MSLPQVSIVIPVYNEEAIIHAAILDLIDRLQGVPWTYEIVIVENGSKDATFEIAEKLMQRFPQLKVLRFGEPNYGGALKYGILASRGTFVICDEIDLCDVGFHRKAIEILEAGEADFVVGSKAMEGAIDERPLLRRVGTKVFNRLLRLTLGFRGTDTHGLKAFRREKVVPIVARCVVDKDLFASELVIRAEREGVRIREIPVRVLEKRVPSIHLLKRVPNVLFNVARLAIVIRRDEMRRGNN
ncbi:MAG: glycosyltransferase family 2 protein [Deltaproteobacteria bacterium]|nr:glycosyltransferase family 2 protein [Deltaproteobacteria bacterium]